MIPQITHIEWTITDSEVEALLLESTLIKEHQPKFNVVLKDDKNYNFVRIDTEDDFPCIETVRRRLDDQAHYFGPFTDGTKLKNTLELLKRIFRPRTCCNKFREVSPGKIEVIKKRTPFPCLRRSIGRCSAPCSGDITRDEYAQDIEQIIQFFSGKLDSLEKSLKTQLDQFAQSQNFEKAVQARDQLLAVQRITEQQKVILQKQIDQDVWGIASYQSRWVATLLQIRSGKLLDQKNFLLQGAGEPSWSGFLFDYYSQASSYPGSILFPAEIPDLELLSELFSQKHSRNLNISTPQRGEKKKLVGLANRNAQDYLDRQKASWEAEQSQPDLGQELAKLLSRKEPIRIIEGFDISHLGGTETVASCVRFTDGKADNQNYRRFTLRTIARGEIDDFKSMREVLERRLIMIGKEQKEFPEKLREFQQKKKEHDKLVVKSKKLKKPKELPKFTLKEPVKIEFPDLILIDGGKGQLSAAYDILCDQKLQSKIDMIGLAKREEEIFLPQKSKPILLKKSDPILHLLQQVRDESHRFAITHQRQRRQKGITTTKLEDIPGIGARTRQKLVQVFGSTLALKKATQKEIAAVVGDKAAQKIKQGF